MHTYPYTAQGGVVNLQLTSVTLDGPGHGPAALLDALLDEYEIMRELRHPNVLLVIGIATDHATNTGIVTELMQASLLDVLLDSELAPSVTWPSCLLAVATDVAKGMAYLHYNDFLHRGTFLGSICTPPSPTPPLPRIATRALSPPQSPLSGVGRERSSQTSSQPTSF